MSMLCAIVGAAGIHALGRIDAELTGLDAG